MQRALGRSTQSRRNGVLQGGNSSFLGRAPEPEIILSSLKDKAEAAFLVMLDPQRFIICPGFLAERGENGRILLPFLLWQDHADLISSQSASSSSPSAPTLSKRQRKKMAKAIHQQNSFLPRDLSEWLPQGPVASNDQDKNSRKKLKKKSKKTKKTSAGTKSETSSSKEVSGSSASATCGDTDLANEGPYTECELPEITQAEYDTEGNSISRAKQPETPNTVVSHSDGVVAASSPVPSSVSEDFHSVDSRISATNEMENRYSILSSFDEETAYTHESTDSSSEVFFDARSAPFTEPFYDEWNSYESTNVGDDIEVQSSVREDSIINPSETSEYSKYGYLDRPGSRGLSSGTSSHEGVDGKDRHLSGNSSVQNLGEAMKSSSFGPIRKKSHYIWREDQEDDVCEGISNSSDSSLLQLHEFPTVAECGNKGNKRSGWRRSSDLPSVLPIKSEQKDKNLSEFSISARILSLEGNVSSGPIGKENHLVRQKKVRKDDVVEGVSESSASSGLQFDSSLKEAPLSNRVSNVLGSEEVVKSKDDSKPKATDMPYKEALQHPVQVKQKVQRPLRRARLEDFTGRSQTRTIDPNAFLVRQERLQRTGNMEPLTISELAKWKDERKDLENVTETASHAIDGKASKPVGNFESSKDERSELDVCATVSPQVDYNDCERFVDSEIDKDERQNVTKTASHAIDSKPVANLESSKDETNGLDVCATVSPQGDYNACDRVVDSEIDKDERKVLQYVTKTASHAIDRKDSKPVSNLESSKDERSGLDVCTTVSPQGDYIACDRVVDSNTSEEVLQAVCTTVSDTNGKTSSSSTPEIADQTYSLLGLSERCSPIPVSDATINIQQIEDSCPESGNQGHISGSGSISKKWLPVPRQDASGETGKRTYENSLASVDKSVSGGLTLQKHGGKKLNPDAHVFVPLQSNNVRNVGKSFAIPTGRDRIPILKNPPLTDRVQNLQIEKLRTLATDESDKIVQAVGDAYRTEMRSIGVDLATSKPLAEFETFLHSASPVLGPTRTPHDCTSCSRDHFIGTSLCKHEIPDASLGRIWQWYEEHSSFGLKIKKEDCPKFSAYYVPSLSAVQLFGNCRSTSDCSRGSSRAKALKAVGESKYDADLVKSSGLLPQPSGNASAADFSSPCSSSSMYGEDEFIDRSLGMTPLESELLFEYYEPEQPFHRRPLFDKIKELVRGGGIQKCQTYGDPKKLESSNLKNLHPSSWYSVAWYPIYRIPQDDLKGAFLTFHSLGHFVRRCTPSDDRGGSTTSIVSPVVGLQSYNTQKESWFKLKTPLMTQTQEEISNHAEILEERLRSLQKTAYAMARAVVNKVDGNIITEHGDLKFFATRGGFK
ncbi:uncharacterized protein LOC113299553 isoform X2 [Papaver somniferum]|nr:uncharacterized protein LOC113299553 isoform X2 [Papaver somniferum]